VKKTKMRGLTDRQLITALNTLHERLTAVEANNLALRAGLQWCLTELKHPAFTADAAGETTTPAGLIVPPTIVVPGEV
jgi:hypothetical protein